MNLTNMYRGIRLFALMSIVFATKENRRPVHIGFFLNDDDFFELSTVAITAVVRRVNQVSGTSYQLRPHIFRTTKSDILEAGLLACQRVKEGVAAIFGPESPEINEMIQSISSTLEIPQFQTFWNPKLRLSRQINPSPVFNLYPSPQSLAQALATLVRESDWKSYTVIYENDEGLLRLQEALNQRSMSDPAVSFRALGPKENHKSVLKEVKSSGVLHLIVDCEAGHIMDILRQAKELKLLSEFHSYILTNLDAHTLDWSEFKNVRTNITALRLVDTNKPNTQHAALVWNQILKYDILRNVKNPAIQKELVNYRKLNPVAEVLPNNIPIRIALLYDALNLFVSVLSKLNTEEEIIWESLSCETNETSSHGQRFSKALREKGREFELVVEPLTGAITSFDEMGYRKKYKLQIIELDSTKFRVTGTWDSDFPQEIQFKLSEEDRDTELKKKIQQRTFRVVSRLGDPYLMRRVDPHGRALYGNDRFEGYTMDLIGEICKPQNLNCSFTFEIVADGKYGNYDPKTKQWNGLIRELLDYKADLGICDLTITYERRKAVDFTLPFMTLGISILYAKAVKEPPELLSFSHPLSFEVWIYIATSYLIISMMMFLVARLNPNDWENPHPCNPCPTELENIWNVKNCFWLTMGSFMAQGCDILPKGISTRMVAAMWWFFTLIITACYTANMTAFLTMSRMGPTIESAEDLAAQTKIKYGCLGGGSTSSFFKDTNFSTYHRMWVQMESAEPSVFESNNKDGVKRVLTSKRKYAFLMESSSIEYEMERNCELMQVGNNLDSKGYGIAMPTNAPYRKSINEAILKMQEMGALHKLKDKWWKEMNGGGQCTKDKSGDIETAEMGLDNVGGVFVVLAVGVALAFMIAVCEFLWNVRKVAVVERLTPKEALIKEIRFAMDIRSRKKVVSTPSRAISLENIDR
ncbi:glutamate receptor ionotropic, kainate 2 isoform X2 [Leptinotarsa decemlineata]|uniref:glutamate receptor ionotropic, kainate 2 isoform X2 n=1 Tax=Leptinotarsa decemlineata TaxID=7539 RepID=UPI003D306556